MTQEVATTEMGLSTLESSVRAAHNLPTNKLILGTLLEISQEIPDNANALSADMAEYLAGRFLKGMDLCGELYAMAVSYEMKTELLKKKEFANAMIIRASEAQIKTAKEKEFYAHSDEQYLVAADTHVAAKMFRLLVEEKKEAFYKAHYLMRKIVEKNVPVYDTPVLEAGVKEAVPALEWRQRSTWSNT